MQVDTGTASADFDIATLPPTLHDIARVVGVQGVVKLVEAYGGVRLYVPQALDADHTLARLLGLPSAQSLAALLGGDCIDVPRCHRAAKRARDAALMRDAAMGMSQRDLARKYLMTERNVRLIWRAAEDQDDRQQGTLF